MKSTNGWVNALLTLIVVAMPAIILYYFTLPGWNDIKDVHNWSLYPISYWLMWVIAISFIIIVTLLMIFFMWLRWVNLDILNFAIPLTLVLMGIYVTPMWPIWARSIIAITLIFTSFPMMMLTTKIKSNIISKSKKGKSV